MGTLKGVSTAIRIKFSSWLEHSWGISSLTVLTIIASVLVVYLSGVLISKWRTPATHIIYGTWVEQFGAVLHRIDYEHKPTRRVFWSRICYDTIAL